MQIHTQVIGELSNGLLHLIGHQVQENHGERQDPVSGLVPQYLVKTFLDKPVGVLRVARISGERAQKMTTRVGSGGERSD